MTNITLARRDAYLDHLKPGIKHDTVTSLYALLHLVTMFPDSALKKAEKEIFYHNNIATLVDHHKRRVGITVMPFLPSHVRSMSAPGNQPGKLTPIAARGQNRKVQGKASNFSLRLAQAQSSYK